jgi:hypothetical protein
MHVQFISFLETFTIHCTFCFNVRKANQGGQSKDKMIGSKGVVNNPCNIVWGDCEVLLFKFNVCMCVYVDGGKNVRPYDWEL